jgi:HPt (histidine-containing phosphotransfer) domain-containing protein
MDGYVSKPINREDLFDAIQAATSRRAEPGSALGGGRADSKTSTPTAPALHMIDEDGLKRMMGGDGDLLRRVVSLFAADAPQKLLGMRAALELRDSRNLHKLAHSLAGSVSNFSAKEAMTATRNLEQMAGGGDLSQAEPALKVVEGAISRLQGELEEIINMPASKMA